MEVEMNVVYWPSVGLARNSNQVLSEIKETSFLFFFLSNLVKFFT